jgi:hypothetical protein
MTSPTASSSSFGNRHESFLAKHQDNLEDLDSSMSLLRRSFDAAMASVSQRTKPKKSLSFYVPSSPTHLLSPVIHFKEAPTIRPFAAYDPQLSPAKRFSRSWNS